MFSQFCPIQKWLKNDHRSHVCTAAAAAVESDDDDSYRKVFNENESFCDFCDDTIGLNEHELQFVGECVC